MAIIAVLFASCKGKDEDVVTYQNFIGTWGVEKIEYYNIDYAGNPIAASFESYSYDINDPNNSIQLVFRDDKTGEMRDGAVDTVWTNWNSETQTYESYIYNPDTTLVTPFTFSYDESESELYMNMKYSYPYTYTHIFMMKISDLTDDSFVYENEYDVDYMEKAYLKRISTTPSKSASRQAVKHPRKPGSFLGDR